MLLVEEEEVHSDWLVADDEGFSDWSDCGCEVEQTSVMFHLGLPISHDETDLIVAETYNGNVKSSSSENSSTRVSSSFPSEKN